MTRKLESNEDLVKDLMNYSPYGALCQVFIMEAIQRYAEQVAASNPEDYDMGAMIAPEAWIGVAKDIKARCEAFYARSR